MKRKLPADEANLFRDAVRDVRPRPVMANILETAKPKVRRSRTESLQTLLQPVAAAESTPLTSNDELSFRRDHITHRVLQRLRRGDYAAAAELDLHGMTAAEARAALTEFISESLQHEHRCVRIIHGKGYRSGARGPVLKNTVNQWLQQCAVVAAFGSARPTDGGSGAVNVLLQRI